MLERALRAPHCVYGTATARGGRAKSLRGRDAQSRAGRTPAPRLASHCEGGNERYVPLFFFLEGVAESRSAPGQRFTRRAQIQHLAAESAGQRAEGRALRSTSGGALCVLVNYDRGQSRYVRKGMRGDRTQAAWERGWAHGR